MRFNKVFFLLFFVSLINNSHVTINAHQYKSMPKATKEDKVRGAWAGKKIGVMYGRSMEF